MSAPLHPITSADLYPTSTPDTAAAALEAGLDLWRDKPAAQQPQWPDQARLESVVSELASVPPLVFAG